MNTRNTILSNILHVTSGQSIALLFGFVTHAYLARVLGPSHYGILGFAVSVVSYFGILASLGTDMWGARSVARADTDPASLTGQVVSVRLVLSSVSLAILAVLLFVWNESLLVNLVILVNAASLFISAFTLDFAFQGLERLNIAARRQMIAAGAALIGILIFMQFDGSVVTAAIIFQVAGMLAVIYMITVFRQTIANLSLKIDLASWKAIITASAPFAVTGIINAVYFSIDVVIIGLLMGKADVGLYVAAGKVLALGLAVSGIFGTVFFPILSRLVTNPGVGIEASGHYARSVVFIGGLVALGGFLLAPEILQILFGIDYLSAELALRILMANLAVAYVVEVYHLQLVAWNHEKTQMYIMLGGAVTNVILNLIFIPKFGIEAAAATTLICSLLVFGLANLLLQRHQEERHHSTILRNWVMFLIFALVGYQLVTQIDFYSHSVVVRFVILGSGITVTYCLAGWVIRAIRPTEILRYLNKEQK